MNVVLIAAWVLAVVSAFIVPVDSGYLSYIDWRTLGLLFSLMAVMAGLRTLGIFKYSARHMLVRVKTTRQLELILVGMCFISSMVITNDVALITFVPFAIEVLEMAGMKKSIIPVVVFQTVAANLGSMMTPIGNPQNLYLYSKSGASAGHLFMLMLPYGAAAAILIILFVVLRKNMRITALRLEPEQPLGSKWKLVMYTVLFVICLLAVARFIPVWAVTALVFVMVVITDIRTILKVDYSLLLTFAGFFIFIGNMGRITAFSDLLNRLMGGHEVIVSVAASQVLSNVPAALLLSGFTQNYDALFVGTNLGGLGTLIASMASLISYRFVAGRHGDLKGGYFTFFTGINIVFLLILLGEYYLLMLL